MAEGSPGHAFLAMNLGGELRNGLRGKKCRVAGSDLLLQTGRKEMYVYPDVMVICGPVEAMEGRPNVGDQSGICGRGFITEYGGGRPGGKVA